MVILLEYRLIMEGFPQSLRLEVLILFQSEAERIYEIE